MYLNMLFAVLFFRVTIYIYIFCLLDIVCIFWIFPFLIQGKDTATLLLVHSIDAKMICSVVPFQVMHLTENIQLILDALRTSNVLEVQVYLKNVL